MTDHYTSITMAKTPKPTKSIAGENLKQQELPFIAGENVNGTATLEDSLAMLIHLNIILLYDPAIVLLGIN